MRKRLHEDEEKIEKMFAFPDNLILNIEAKLWTREKAPPLSLALLSVDVGCAFVIY